MVDRLPGHDFRSKSPCWLVKAWKLCSPTKVSADSRMAVMFLVGKWSSVQDWFEPTPAHTELMHNFALKKGSNKAVNCLPGHSTAWQLLKLHLDSIWPLSLDSLPKSLMKSFFFWWYVILNLSAILGRIPLLFTTFLGWPTGGKGRYKLPRSYPNNTRGVGIGGKLHGWSAPHRIGCFTVLGQFLGVGNALWNDRYTLEIDRMNPNMEVWFKWFSRSIGWFLGSILIFMWRSRPTRGWLYNGWLY